MSTGKPAPTTDEQRRILEMNRNHPGATPKDILGMLDDPALNVEYVQRIIHDFELPDDNPAKQMSADTDAEEGDDSEAAAEDRTGTHRTLETLGDKSREVVDTIRDDPEIELDAVYEELPNTSRNHIKNTIQKFSHLIPDDAAVWKKIQNPEDVDDPAAITADKRREIIEAIRENPTAQKDDIEQQVTSSTSYITATMQMYQHLLPDEWCIRFPSLSSREYKPAHHGDSAAEAGRKGGQNGSREPEAEVDVQQGEQYYHPHNDPEEEIERLRNINNLGLIDDDEFERRRQDLLDEIGNEAEAGDEPDGEDGGSDATIRPDVATETADEDEDEDEGSDATIRPDIATETADAQEPETDGSEADDEGWTIANQTPAKEMAVVDPDRVEQLHEEVEMLEGDSGEELSAYAKGVRHALTVLDLDS